METVSIITVCYNAEKEIEKTIQSVLSQDYLQYEYIIVDGDSTDNTMEIVEKYDRDFKKKGIAYKVLSEGDAGIYDAMNKGCKLSSGDWIIYMNAGDCFYDKDVLSKVFSKDYSQIDILYGNAEMCAGEYYRLWKGRDFEQITFRMPFCHQSVFVKRTLIMENQFDISYRIAGDYDLFVRLYKKKVKYKYVDIIISIYDLTGVSERMQIVARKEDDLIREKNGIERVHSLMYDIIFTKIVLFRRKWTIKLAPHIYYSEKRGWYKKSTQ